MNLSYSQIKKILQLIDREIGNMEDNAYRYTNFGTTDEDKQTGKFIYGQIKEWKKLREELEK